MRRALYSVLVALVIIMVATTLVKLFIGDPLIFLLGCVLATFLWWAGNRWV